MIKLIFIIVLIIAFAVPLWIILNHVGLEGHRHICDDPQCEGEIKEFE